MPLSNHSATRALAVLMQVVLLASVPAARTWAAPVAGGSSFRDLNFQLPGAGWEVVDAPTTAGLAPTVVSFARTLDAHRLAVSLIEVQAENDARVLGRDDLVANVFDSIRQKDMADVAQAPGAHRQELPDVARTIAGMAYPVSRSRITVDGSSTVTDGLYLLYFPADFADRHRFIELAWIDAHPRGVDVGDLAVLDGLVTSLQFRPLGGVLLADDMSDPQHGALPNAAPNPPTYQRGYVDGEYMLRVDATDQVASAATRDEYADATLSVDAHAADDTPAAAIWLYCRRSGAAPSGYRLRVDPATQTFALDRLDRAQPTTLVSPRTADAINTGSDLNHFELTCAGSSISGSINGQPVFSVRDTSYTQGTFNIGVSGPPDAAGEARFVNLAVLQA